MTSSAAASGAALLDVANGLSRAALLEPGRGWLDLRLAADSTFGVRGVGEAGANLGRGWSVYGEGWLARGGWGAAAGVRATW